MSNKQLRGLAIALVVGAASLMGAGKAYACHLATGWCCPTEDWCCYFKEDVIQGCVGNPQ
ncbi:MAG TPA: hypothetical protein VM890_00475 [Longimicrobium sp.]|nr:hypothetical protein [Longimicrobium sp.]